MEKIQALWNDITTGNLPLLCDNEHHPIENVTPISCYSNYTSDEKGTYDLTIMAETLDFFTKMEEKIAQGTYLLYEETMMREISKLVQNKHGLESGMIKTNSLSNAALQKIMKLAFPKHSQKTTRLIVMYISQSSSNFYNYCFSIDKHLFIH
jgi:hypothetical protein